MTETNQKIMDMILKNASVNEISRETGLSNKQLFHRLNMLKIKGYNFSRKYYYNGEIVYKLQKGLEGEKEISLITSPKDKEFKAVFISDLHISNPDDRLDLLYAVYNFCIKEDIHVIINGGDLIDGLIGSKDKKFITIEEQIEYALKIHPYDKNILNFICLGNHDYDALVKEGQNLETVLLNRRHDIVPLGYGMGILKIKNDQIVVQHPKTPTIVQKESVATGIILTGHYHKSQTIFRGNTLNMYLGSLTDMNFSNFQDETLPGFVKATIEFNNGIFSLGTFENFVFADKIYKVNELNCELFKGKDVNQSIVKYEEERIPYKEEKIKILEKRETGISQIEKFNKKYSK